MASGGQNESIASNRPFGHDFLAVDADRGKLHFAGIAIDLKSSTALSAFAREVRGDVKASDALTHDHQIMVCFIGILR